MPQTLPKIPLNFNKHKHGRTDTFHRETYRQTSELMTVHQSYRSSTLLLCTPEGQNCVTELSLSRFSDMRVRLCESSPWENRYSDNSYFTWLQHMSSSAHDADVNDPACSSTWWIWARHQRRHSSCDWQLEPANTSALISTVWLQQQQRGWEEAAEHRADRGVFTVS